MFTTVSSISSATVVIFELAWKPRCVTIISANSVAKSTFDISSALDVIVKPKMSTVLMLAEPELFDS